MSDVATTSQPAAVEPGKSDEWVVRPENERMALVGLVPLAAVFTGLFLFGRLPADLRETVSGVVLAPWGPYLLAAAVALFGAFFACGVIREVGEARLIAAWRLVRRLGPASVVAGCAMVLPPLGSIVLFVTIGESSEWLRGHGTLGVTIYAAGFAVMAGLALLPTYAQSALGGYAFGVTWGVPAALAGFLGGAILGHAVARRASGDRVEKIIEEKPKWRAVREALVGAKGLPPAKAFMKQFGMVALLRLPPNSPFALTNLVMASVRVPLAPYLLGTAVGMTPRTALAVAIGAGVQQALTEDALKASTPKWVWIASIAATVVIVLVIGAIANKAIERVTRAQGGQ